MDDVRIQIVNYKTKACLLICLRTLFHDLESTKLTYSVAVLDNASGDDLSDLPAQFPGKPLVVSANEHNVGFGAGHNLLAKRNSANVLFILNPDTVFVEPRTVERLLEQMRQLSAAVIGPRLLTKEGMTQWWDHGELSGLRAQIALRAGHSYYRERHVLTQVAWVSGAALMVTKQWFDKLEGFDEHFFLYKEEEDLCWRSRAHGGTVWYEPTVSLAHHTGTVVDKNDYIQRSVAYFLKKHFSGRLDYPFLRFLHKIVNR